jgi:hypothetical protein
MLVFLNLLLLGVVCHAAPQPQAQADCRYVDEEICHTGRQEVCEDAVEWDCHNATRFIVYGADVEICNPTMRNVCTQKTRYEPEEYEEEECTYTTEEVCIWNYDTVVKKYNATECSTVYEQECTKVPGPPTVITKEELRCTCNICTTVYEEECVPRNCNNYNQCEKCPTEECHKGPTQHTRSGCDDPECETVEIHMKKMSPPGEHCVQRPVEYCQVVEREKSEVVKSEDCNHITTPKCGTVTKTRQKAIVYNECLVRTESGCETKHIYLQKPEVFMPCDPVTREICSEKPKKICETQHVQVCGDH